MQTLNTHEPLPEYFYVFTGHMSPMAWHNFELAKAIVSGAIANISVNGDFVQKYVDSWVVLERRGVMRMI